MCTSVCVCVCLIATTLSFTYSRWWWCRPAGGGAFVKRAIKRERLFMKRPYHTRPCCHTMDDDNVCRERECVVWRGAFCCVIYTSGHRALGLHNKVARAIYLTRSLARRAFWHQKRGQLFRSRAQCPLGILCRLAADITYICARVIMNRRPRVVPPPRRYHMPAVWQFGPRCCSFISLP